MKNFLTKSVKIILKGLVWVGHALFTLLVDILDAKRYRDLSKEDLAMELYRLLKTYENDLKALKHAREICERINRMTGVGLKLEGDYYESTSEMVDITRKQVEKFFFLAGPRFKASATLAFEVEIATKTAIRSLESLLNVKPLKVP